MFQDKLSKFFFVTSRARSIFSEIISFAKLKLTSLITLIKIINEFFCEN